MIEGSSPIVLARNRVEFEDCPAVTQRDGHSEDIAICRERLSPKVP